MVRLIIAAYLIVMLVLTVLSVWFDVAGVIAHAMAWLALFVMFAVGFYMVFIWRDNLHDPY